MSRAAAVRRPRRARKVPQMNTTPLTQPRRVERLVQGQAAASYRPQRKALLLTGLVGCIVGLKLVH